MIFLMFKMTLENIFLNPVFLFLIFWSLVWKYIALWKCGRNNQLGWFIVLCVINTAGILEIVYLLFFRKNMNKKIGPFKKSSIKKKK